MDFSKYDIKKVSKAECEQILSKNHYLSKQGFSFRCGRNYGLFLEDKLIGVAIFHTVSAWETVKGAFGLEDKEQTGFWELGRLAIDGEYAVKNLNSWFVARCIRLLRAEENVRALISYADTAYHEGYIYQALNFAYYGLTAPKKDFWVKQKDGTYKKQSRGATKGVEGGEWRPRSRKHRYMMVFDPSLTVKWTQQPYPKSSIPISGKP